MSPASKVALTRAAIVDLDRLDLFLRRANPATANRLQDRLDEFFVRLGEEPRMGRRRSDGLRSSEVRERVLRFGRSAYIIRYAIEPEAILILRIHHGREDRA